MSEYALICPDFRVTLTLQNLLDNFEFIDFVVIRAGVALADETGMSGGSHPFAEGAMVHLQHNTYFFQCAGSVGKGFKRGHSA